MNMIVNVDIPDTVYDTSSSEEDLPLSELRSKPNPTNVFLTDGKLTKPESETQFTGNSNLSQDIKDQELPIHFFKHHLPKEII